MQWGKVPSRLLFPQRFFPGANLLQQRRLAPGSWWCWTCRGYLFIRFGDKKLYISKFGKGCTGPFSSSSKLAIFGDELEPWRVMIMKDGWNGRTSFLARVIYLLKRFAGVFENCCVFFSCFFSIIFERTAVKEVITISSFFLYHHTATKSTESRWVRDRSCSG